MKVVHEILSLTEFVSASKIKVLTKYLWIKDQDRPQRATLLPQEDF